MRGQVRGMGIGVIGELKRPWVAVLRWSGMQLMMEFRLALSALSWSQLHFWENMNKGLKERSLDENRGGIFYLGKRYGCKSSNDLYRSLGVTSSLVGQDRGLGFLVLVV